MDPIYLDYNATTPLDPAVVEAMRPYFETHFGNPSSSHVYGVRARQAVEQARAQVAALLGARPEEIVFTSGGSESNNLAIRGMARALHARGNHIITSAIEHPAVMEVCRYLEGEGYRLTVVPVDSDGLVDPAEVERALTPATILVTIMHANNEVGTIQPLAEIAALARRRGIAVHTDAAQSAGKIATHVGALGVDLLSLAGHKLYAPKGVGALYIRTGVEPERLIHGADHERGWRAGTENVLEIVGLGRACALAAAQLEERAAHLQRLRDRLHAGIAARIPDVRLNGHPERRLPNTASLAFPGLEAAAILAELTSVAASAGAACHSGGDAVEMSPTLAAMGVPPAVAMGTIRFSTGSFLSEADIDRAAAAVCEVVERLRPPAGAAADEDAAGTGGDAAPGEPLRLTRYTAGLGCACKLRPQALERVLAALPAGLRPPQVLVGFENADDAAVYELPDGSAIVETVDFFTPVVDDPFTFGAIAAANALSDIYAMGARPLFALGIAGFPSGRLPLAVLEAILRGGHAVADEAGIPIIGGHTVDDLEPKYGLVVTGIVDPRAMWTNAGAQPGDAILLTKPLGLGIMTTALKRGQLDAAQIEHIQRLMRALNRTAAEVLREQAVHACTDVTGFGLLGHLREMAVASGVDVEIEQRALPLIPGAAELATGGTVPGGTRNNLAFVEPHVSWAAHVSATERLLACDAQTSGGLLAALPAAGAAAAVEALRAAGVEDAARIGCCTAAGAGRIAVV